MMQDASLRNDFSSAAVLRPLISKKRSVIRCEFDVAVRQAVGCPLLQRHSAHDDLGPVLCEHSDQSKCFSTIIIERLMSLV